MNSPAPAHDLDPASGFDFSKLELSLRRPGTFFSSLMSVIVTVMTMLALIPLFSVIGLLLWRGGRKLSIAALTELPPAPLDLNGGFGNAIAGTLVIVGIATLISLPIGLHSAIYLAQAKPGNRFASAVRFTAKVLTGLPSILAGVFAYGLVVVATGGYSAAAGAAALSVLMMPTILLTSEDAIRMVPARIRDAAIGMGATDTQAVWMVLLPTAAPRILTGVMLAIARGAGETAPLLFTSLFSNYWLIWHGHVQLMQPTASLSVLIYNFSSVPFVNQVELAWAAALVLVLMVLAVNLIGQSLSRPQESQER
jgi:phosphate transport system permease protein